MRRLNLICPLPGARRSRRIFAACALAAVVARLGPAWAQDPPNGSEIFTSSGCFVCHGQMGNGGAGASFRGDRFLLITDYVVAQILLGRGIMPSFADKLNDRHIAAVASYIRTSWGNRFGGVKPEEAAQIRTNSSQWG
ncbi:MAG: cytochrome c, partial [Alphaproteobacteria bacterium]|nr:cytochrome c [Alphaproteobacteria bacterium]